MFDGRIRQMMKKLKEIEIIKNKILLCKKCLLYKTRMKPVVGEGNLKAKIMLIGEAPGANEDRSGRPFCGAAGKVLDGLLNSAGIRREDVYIANILKCRPPGNRPPKPEEIKACTPYLEMQIKAIRPRIISCLGNFATSFIFRKFGLEDRLQGISRIHGKIFNVDFLLLQLKIVPLYHPAVAVYNGSMKETLEKDFQILSSLI